jgi:hypothetical protein
MGQKPLLKHRGTEETEVRNCKVPKLPKIAEIEDDSCCGDAEAQRESGTE